MNITTEWLLAFEDCDEPTGYVTNGERKELNRRQAEARLRAVQNAGAKASSSNAVRQSSAKAALDNTNHNINQS